MIEPGVMFDTLAESTFIDRLAEYRGLCFVGDEDALRDLERRLSRAKPANDARFLALNEARPADGSWLRGCEKLCRSWFRRPAAIVTVSLSAEDSAYEALIGLGHERRRGVPLLRLIPDLFVNHCSGDELTRPVSETPREPALAYAIITTPRTGSSYLCQLLESTRVAGFPREHLRHPTETLTRQCGFDHVRLLRHLMARQTTDNGVFGTKLISHFLRDHMVERTLETRRLLSGFRFVRLTRRDVAAQAVSIYLAKRTNIWHLHSHAEQEDYSKAIGRASDPSDADLAEIHGYYLTMLEQEAWIDRLLEELGVSPLVLDYEELVGAPGPSVERILDFLGLAMPQGVAALHSSMHKLGSNRSDEIRRSFERAYGLATECP